MSRGPEKYTMQVTKAERNFILMCRQLEYAKIDLIEVLDGEPINVIEIHRKIRLDLTDDIRGIIMRSDQATTRREQESN